MTTTERIACKKAQTLYVKKGKRYVPASDPWGHDGLREGWWLVGVKPGSVSIRQQVWPDKAPLTAAARDLEEKLVEIIRKAGEARPAKFALTLEEKKDWEWFIKKHGESFNTLHYPSIQENAEKIVAVLVERAERGK